MSERASNRVRGFMAAFAGLAALLFVFSFVSTVPSNASAGPFPLVVNGYIYDSVGRTVEGADVTVTILTGGTPVSTRNDVSSSTGAYSTWFDSGDWEVGYDIEVVAVYEGSAPEMETAVAPNANSIQIDIHFTFEIPEFGAEWGLLVAGLAVGTVAVVALVWRRK